MPFKSARQRKFLYAQKPAVAREFAAKERAKPKPPSKPKPKRKGASR